MRINFLLLAFLLAGCDGNGVGSYPTTPPPPVQDDTAFVQAAVDVGGVVTFAAKTYHLSRTILIKTSATSIVGVGPETVFDYQPSAQTQHCATDRVFTTPCTFEDAPPRRIAAPIAVGDKAFSAFAAADVADLKYGDWLLINDVDSVFGDKVAIDWVQVAGVSGVTVNLVQPFRMAFTTARPWDPGKSGLGFTPIPLIENIQMRNFKVVVERTPTTPTAGISLFGVMNADIDRVTVENHNGQPFYSFLSKGVTVTNSQAIGGRVLSEFASSVDLTLSDNHFTGDGPGFGLDLGLGFFSVTNNWIDQSDNIGFYVLYGVHDGTISGNHVAYVNYVPAGGNAAGLVIRGSQNIAVSDNSFAGGSGPRSVGISVGGAVGEIPLPSINIGVSGNTINGFVTPVQE